MSFSLIQTFLILYILITPITSLNFILNTKSINQTSLRNLHSPSSVYGSVHEMNYYYSHLYIGKEEKRQSYILDTGSSVTTSPCNLCKECGKHENGLYNIDKNNILKCSDEKCSLVNNKCFSKNENDCEFHISYSEGSTIKGKFINEVIKIGDKYINDTYFNFPIGCTNSENHLFKTQFADGIMGLQKSDKSFPSILYKLNIINKNIFSLCLAEEGGYFTVGEILSEAHLNNNIINYVNLTDDKFYKVNLNFIEINNLVIPVNEENEYNYYGSIIDSGTTISYFPDKFANKIYDEINKICNLDKNKNKCGKLRKDNDLGNCYIFKNYSQLNYALDYIMPNISFNLNKEYNYTWESRNYFFNISSKNEIGFCLGFVGEIGSKFTFGSSWMKNYDFIFDIKESKVGIIKSNCNYLKNNVNNSDQNIYNQSMNNDKIINNHTVIFNDYLNKENILYSIIGFLLFIILILLIAVYKLKNGKNFLCIHFKYRIMDYSKAEIEMIRNNSETLEIMNNNEPAINTVAIPTKHKTAKVISLETKE